MADYFKDNGTAALKVIDTVEDETLKTFLKMEIEHILLKQKWRKLNVNLLWFVKIKALVFYILLFLFSNLQT